MPQGRNSLAWTLRVLLVLAASFALTAGATLADNFVNFEEPQTQPITVIRLEIPGIAQPAPVSNYALKAEAELEPIVLNVLAVANTPDNSVEFYEADFPWGFLGRVRSGLGPVTVRWNEEHQRLYVCNFSGDSVSMVHLWLNANGSLGYALERIVDVGDEPSDIAFSPDDATAYVTLSSQSGITVRNATDLSVVNAFDRLNITVGSEDQAVKMPRQIAVDSNGRMMVLNLMGELAPPLSGLTYDLDLYVEEAGGVVSQVNGLGTTNHAFAFSADGTKMFVVGTRAGHFDGTGVVQVSQLVTGFVQSWLWVLDVPPTGAPVPVAESVAGPGPSWPVLQSINLNRDYSVAALTEVTPKSQALSQPTDVVVLSDQDGGVQKLFLTAYHSDKIARLQPDANAPGGWDIKRIKIPVLKPAQKYTIAGPRGLTIGKRLKNRVGSNDTFVFVANRLDNTVAVVSTTSETIVGHFSLQYDPTPDVIRVGREHLYDAERHSGNGMVSCASCHVDARTDGLPWNLGEDKIGPPIGPGFHDRNGQTLITMPDFPDDKGPMITQTLLGLVNYPTNEAGQGLFTNAPYHWRGDKDTVDDFNEAFVNLQGTPNVSGDPNDPKGLSDPKMRDYRLFVNTLRHPPNPDQARDRRQTGVLGDDPNDTSLATGTNLGMVLYHNHLAVDVRSCSDCHSTGNGSSSSSTLTFSVPRTVTTGPDQEQPIETAALRSIRQRESQIFTATENLKTANFGLMHDGVLLFASSLENFIAITFGTMTAGERLAVIEFVQQFDTGIAPAAGLAHTLGQPNDNFILDLLEDQVREANIGVAVHVRSGNTVKGYWYDTTVSPAMYREEGSTTNLLSRATLQSMAAAGDTVIFQGCPLGTERRWASATGKATVLTGQPSGITLEAMAPPTHWLGVAGLNQFAWQLPPGILPTNSNMWTRDAFQQALIPTPSFGIPMKRHEPPRRFRVTGDNIRPGAQLHIGMPMTAPQSAPLTYVSLDLYPTQYTGDGGRQIWETSEDMAPNMTLVMLNGGPWAPDVVATFQRTTTTPNLQPVLWNGFEALVQNEDGSLSTNTGVFHVLTVQDGR